MIFWTGQSGRYNLVGSHMIGKISDVSSLIHLTQLQSFMFPPSREVGVSLNGKEAVLPTDGKSKGDAFRISSDDDSDTEDEDDAEGQDIDDLQSCTTSTTSIADHFGNFFTTISLSRVSTDSLFINSRSTKHSPSELDAAIGVNTTPSVYPALGEEDPDLTQASHMGPLADPGPRQISPYQRDLTSARVTTACIEASFNVSPPSAGSQPHPSVSGVQQLSTGATSERDIVIVDPLATQTSRPLKVRAADSRDGGIYSHPLLHTRSGSWLALATTREALT